MSLIRGGEGRSALSVKEDAFAMFILARWLAFAAIAVLAVAAMEGCL